MLLLQRSNIRLLLLHRFEPPAQGLAVLDNSSDRWAAPEGYDQCVIFPHPRSENAVSIWFPQAPAGYTAVGCVACPGTSPPPTSLVRCVRRDLLRPAGYAAPPIWDTEGMRGVPTTALWRVQNEVRLFHGRKEEFSFDSGAVSFLFDVMRPSSVHFEASII
jgi:vacuolar protein sorting-associated protein 13A/C